MISFCIHIHPWCVQNRWAAKFSDLVSRAVELAVIHPGAKGSYDGALQVVTYLRNYILLFDSIHILEAV